MLYVGLCVFAWWKEISAMALSDEDMLCDISFCINLSVCLGVYWGVCMGLCWVGVGVSEFPWSPV